jgi:hypothetical protein
VPASVAALPPLPRPSTSSTKLGPPVPPPAKPKGPSENVIPRTDAKLAGPPVETKPRPVPEQKPEQKVFPRQAAPAPVVDRPNVPQRAPSAAHTDPGRSAEPSKDDKEDEYYDDSKGLYDEGSDDALFANIELDVFGADDSGIGMDMTPCKPPDVPPVGGGVSSRIQRSTSAQVPPRGQAAAFKQQNVCVLFPKLLLHRARAYSVRCGRYRSRLRRRFDDLRLLTSPHRALSCGMGSRAVQSRARWLRQHRSIYLALASFRRRNLNWEASRVREKF